jgi:double-stranded RNA-binding protein Staufen
MNEPLTFVNQPVTIEDPFRKGDPPARVAVHVGERVFTGEGNGFNSAKNLAVMIALKALLQVRQERELAKMIAAGTAQPEGLENENKSPISIVHEMAMKRNMGVSFDVTKEAGPPHLKVFTVQCSVGDFRTEADGATKQVNI